MCLREIKASIITIPINPTNFLQTRLSPGVTNFASGDWLHPGNVPSTGELWPVFQIQIQYQTTQARHLTESFAHMLSAVSDKLRSLRQSINELADDMSSLRRSQQEQASKLDVIADDMRFFRRSQQEQASKLNAIADNVHSLDHSRKKQATDIAWLQDHRRARAIKISQLKTVCKVVSGHDHTKTFIRKRSSQGDTDPFIKGKDHKTRTRRRTSLLRSCKGSRLFLLGYHMEIR
ncbi:hypothetical protein BCR33DRAFT_713115 [Rhizoclosmatium globosum]|uniref:Uncharacterized protein n=1 Tax=Rhizoclosmatium globosum TaxID=329046 RepID=A0A1Y2CVC5_9FUNG|nr:hypothetical protein BCR33DRAFT_713115 [Rhizoclosmatium globosum]|eukprot:ORY50285.1 hypothetical protein BCR33DRAFT_713115 [Rhizoclosmatium globosum]